MGAGADKTDWQGAAQRNGRRFLRLVQEDVEDLRTASVKSHEGVERLEKLQASLGAVLESMQKLQEQVEEG